MKHIRAEINKIGKKYAIEKNYQATIWFIEKHLKSDKLLLNQLRGGGTQVSNNENEKDDFYIEIRFNNKKMRVIEADL